MKKTKSGTVIAKETKKVTVRMSSVGISFANIRSAYTQKQAAIYTHAYTYMAICRMAISYIITFSSN